MKFRFHYFKPLPSFSEPVKIPSRSIKKTGLVFETVQMEGSFIKCYPVLFDGPGIWKTYLPIQQDSHLPAPLRSDPTLLGTWVQSVYPRKLGVPTSQPLLKSWIQRTDVSRPWKQSCAAWHLVDTGLYDSRAPLGWKNSEVTNWTFSVYL